MCLCYSYLVLLVHKMKTALTYNSKLGVESLLLKELI